MRNSPEAQNGFTLLEMVCVLSIVAMLVGILLPRLSPGTSRPRLEASALEIASLLKIDRNAAVKSGMRVLTRIDASTRRLQSGSNGSVLVVPDDVTLDALLPRDCEGRPALSTISFFPSGFSCGGTLRLSRLNTVYEVRVNWLTGGIEIVRVPAV
ncbi:MULTISPECIES: GspH/FimT family pseudopilin [Bradyrhizobium]|nr:MULTISPECIES: GspH/FimT family pseudopilin [Bradyrhizobium]QOZ49465.1 type II secretion system protein GspH [Bradyrhizobium sp. CCBAU 53340]QOZ56579.1 type II secretion system protein GspH [Bradyrhizobium sp. CCBAU 53338]QOZ81223.1 type II secretion system protein GspH [Bradyrhizobium sp. CCBAU 53351]MDN4985867.1 prepilin-type N-terminal cleavage/methylation domain-containing protein [Bradyrhizobium sp. WYCCWR 13022]MDN5002754.1 prepilin-type N-terminal cleavage/methylation domain-containin